MTLSVRLQCQVPCITEDGRKNENFPSLTIETHHTNPGLVKLFVGEEAVWVSVAALREAVKHFGN